MIHSNVNLVHPVIIIRSQQGGGLENEIYFLRDKTIEYRKSTYIQDPPMQKMKVLAQFYDALIKILLSKNCQKFG